MVPRQSIFLNLSAVYNSRTVSVSPFCGFVREENARRGTIWQMETSVQPAWTVSAHQIDELLPVFGAQFKIRMCLIRLHMILSFVEIKGSLHIFTLC